MLFQQSAELNVLCPQGSLCIAHTVMIADRHDARHACGGIRALESEHQLVPAGDLKDMPGEWHLYAVATA
jgi:hypothetical protein